MQQRISSIGFAPMSEETVLAMTQSSIDLHPRQSISLAGNTTPVMQLETFHTEEEDVANHSRRHTKLQLATIMSMLYVRCEPVPVLTPLLTDILVLCVSRRARYSKFQNLPIIVQNH